MALRLLGYGSQTTVITFLQSIKKTKAHKRRKL